MAMERLVITAGVITELVMVGDGDEHDIVGPLDS